MIVDLIRTSKNPYFVPVKGWHTSYIRKYNFCHRRKYLECGPHTFACPFPNLPYLAPHSPHPLSCAVAFETIKFLNALPAEEKERFRVEAESMGYFEEAFQRTYTAPATYTFGIFNWLYQFNMNKALYEPTMEQLVSTGQYELAANLLAELGVFHEPYLYKVLLPAIVTVSPDRRQYLLRYLKECPEVTDMLHQLLTCLSQDQTLFETLVEQHRLVGMEVNEQTAERVHGARSWLVANCSIKNTVPKTHMAHVNRLICLRTRNQIQRKVFWHQITHSVSHTQVALQNFLVGRLACEGLMRDAKDAMEYFSVNIERIDPFIRAKLEIYLEGDRIEEAPESSCERKNGFKVPDAYELITSEAQFLQMVANCKAKVIAVTGIYKENELILLQLMSGRKAGPKIMIVDVLAGQFSPDLWQRLATALNGAALLVGNSRTHLAFKCAEFANLAEPMSKEVLNMIEFFEYLKGSPQHQSRIHNCMPHVCRDMRDVVFQVLRQQSDYPWTHAIWSIRPLLAESLASAATMVAMVFESYQQLNNWYKHQLPTIFKSYITQKDEVPAEEEIDFTADVDC